MKKNKNIRENIFLPTENVNNNKKKFTRFRRI